MNRPWRLIKSLESIRRRRRVESLDAFKAAVIEGRILQETERHIFTTRYRKRLQKARSRCVNMKYLLIT